MGLVDRVTMLTTERLNKQVEHFHKSEENDHPVPKGYMISKTRTGKDGNIVRTNIGGEETLAALIRLKEHLNSNQINLVTDIAINMLTMPENDISNRIGILDQLANMWDRIGTEQQQKILDILAEMIQGTVSLTSEGMEPPSDIFSRFKVSAPGVIDLRKSALRTLAEIDSVSPLKDRSFVHGMLSKSVNSDNSDIRRATYWALGIVNDVPDHLVDALFAGMNEQSPRTQLVVLRALMHRYKSLSDRQRETLSTIMNALRFSQFPLLRRSSEKYLSEIGEQNADGS